MLLTGAEEEGERWKELKKGRDRQIPPCKSAASEIL
jgi:hypothetical protein